MKTNFKVKDHSVSGKEFTLRYDQAYHMYVTEPKPLLQDIDSYYESENYISHTDGRRSLFEIVYQTVKGITLSRKHKLLQKHHPRKGSILDIGAGTGDFMEHLSKRDWNTQGVEPNPKARTLAEKKGLKVQSDILSFGKIRFDVITLWHVLEHVYDLPGQLKWLKEHLADTGTIFVAVPNFKSYDAQKYNSYWAAYDVPRHLYHFSEKAIALLFEEVGLRLVETHPMKFDAYYVSLLSEKYRSGRMKFIKAFQTGWKSNRKAKSSGHYSSLIYVLKHDKT